MQIKNILIKKDIKQQLLEQRLLEQQLLEQQLLEQLIKYSYNHFKGSKKAFNYNPYNGIKLNRFRLLAMLERLKSAINKIFRLNICKNKIILKIIIIKIIVLIRNNVNDIKYQKPQKLRYVGDS